MTADGALLAGGFLLFSSTVALICLERKRHRQRIWRERLTYKKLSKSRFLTVQFNAYRSDLGASFGLDIGGTLAKIVYFERHDAGNDTRKRPRSASLDVAAGEMNKFLRENHSFGSTGVQDVRLRIHAKSLNGVFHFVRFESNKTRDAIEFIAINGINQSLRILPCTGGGAHKYGRAFTEIAGIELEKYDEIDCTILGLHLLLTTLSDEVYTFEVVDFNSLAASRVKTIQTDTDEDVYPYLLVSIGSGVSVLYVKGPGDYERVSGSSIGGGTYWGLCRLLTHCESYDEALDLCVHGSNKSVDMSVGDIYGGAYDKFKLPASTVASSFGKMISTSRESVSDADLARSLLVMITQNIGQVAFLNATLYKTKNIFFVGNFLRHNKISSRTLAYAINFWSNGAMEARFCKHEGYLGALGAFLRHAEATNAHGEEFVSATRGSRPST
ncbi:Pantothenate kinase 3 [Phytophthora citrophthora]|uniref:pantothenate kinase n=1 Tax=Phytophthora citrophthora TaxID=4793 RepID=A0AAD9GTJ0_9STRA|nr:Pantothenate kinase 3 [Phytophthora citrophthora]